MWAAVAILFATFLLVFLLLALLLLHLALFLLYSPLLLSLDTELCALHLEFSVLLLADLFLLRPCELIGCLPGLALDFHLFFVLLPDLFSLFSELFPLLLRLLVHLL